MKRGVKISLVGAAVILMAAVIVFGWLFSKAAPKKLKREPQRRLKMSTRLRTYPPETPANAANRTALTSACEAVAYPRANL